MDRAARRLGRYEVLREIGRGGMAVVYLGRQPGLEREVALKELAAFNALDPAAAERFTREARVAASLSHPNIATVFELFEHGGTPYIAMEYVPRGSLRAVVGTATQAQVAGVLEGLLAGLTHAEARGVVHRDLKPENVLVTAEGAVKLADFGVAKAYNRVWTLHFPTATGFIVGTPTYMAPEQVTGKGVGPWTDLYAAGVIAYELLAGRPPFHDIEGPAAMLWHQMAEPVPPLRSLAPEVDERLAGWIERLLAKDPTQRPPGALAAWNELEPIVLDLLGPVWRREAPLVRAAGHLTPAPFELGPAAGKRRVMFQPPRPWAAPGSAPPEK